jgi:hypothetical protein
MWQVKIDFYKVVYNLGDTRNFYYRQSANCCPRIPDIPSLLLVHYYPLLVHGCLMLGWSKIHVSIFKLIRIENQPIKPKMTSISVIVQE